MILNDKQKTILFRQISEYMNNTNISEFERTKPTKTMALLNALIKDIKEGEAYVDLTGDELIECLKKIKESLKRGE